jgi:hypothetical protein
MAFPIAPQMAAIRMRSRSPVRDMFMVDSTWWVAALACGLRDGVGLKRLPEGLGIASPAPIMLNV